MSTSSRKEFIKKLGLAGFGAVAGSSRLLSKSANYSLLNWKKIDSIGLQLYSIIPVLKNDFEGTLRTLAEIGFKEVECAGPYFFSPGSDGKSSGYYGNTAKQMRDLLDRYGLTAPSAHIGLETLQSKLPQVLEAAHTVGHSFIVCPFLNADQRTSLDDYKELAEQFNGIGEECKKADIRFAYHNHCFEFGEMDGKIPYNVLLEMTVPGYVKMEMDLYWISIAGYDPVDYFNSYPGRFPLVHVKDMKKKVVLEDPAHVFEEEGPRKKAMANLQDVGKGVLDFKRILSHHKEAGIEHYFIERDMPPHPMESMRNGYHYLSRLDID